MFYFSPTAAPLGPVRYTNADVLSVKIASSDDVGKQFIPGISANVFTVKIASSDVGFPVDVYGTVIARDSLDRKCVYLFKCECVIGIIANTLPLRYVGTSV